MNRNARIAVWVVAILTSAVAAGQMTAPTPAPELKKLDYFTGAWTTEATIPSGPWGNGGKFTDNVSAQWMKGDFFLVAHADFSLPAELGGAGAGISIVGYDSDKKVYTEERFDSLGRRVVMTGTLDGDTWKWTGENNMGGMTINSRITMKMVSPTSYTSKYEVSADGGSNWLPFWEGKATKK